MPTATYTDRAALLAAGPGLSYTTIDFATFDDGSPMSGQSFYYNQSLRGVSFAGFSTYYEQLIQANPLRATLPPNTYSVGSSLFTAQGPFSPPGSWTLTLSTGQTASGPLGTPFFGATSATPIAWVEINYTGDAAFYDNFVYGVAPDEAQTITFTSTPPNPAEVGASYSLIATGGGSGNPVTFSSGTPTVCTVVGTEAALVATGTCIILADQAAGPGFTAAPQASQSFEVTAPPPALLSFTGFFRPVDGNGVLNVMKAGAAVPLKFSLNGDHGLGVLQGSPTSTPISCSNGATDQIEETVAASTSGLQYDAAADQYIYVWKTNAGWKNTCRRFVLALTDGTTHVASFAFPK